MNGQLGQSLDVSPPQLPLYLICSVIDGLDHLLHGCSPWRSHRPLLHLGGHFSLDEWVLRSTYKLIELFLVDLFHNPLGPLSRTNTLYGESLS